MILKKREWQTGVGDMNLKRLPHLTVIQYGVGSFASYHQRLDVINTYYLRMSEQRLYGGLMAYLSVIVERLNNLSYFFSQAPTYHEEAFVVTYLTKFETFHPQPLSELTLISKITLHQVQAMTKKELFIISADMEKRSEKLKEWRAIDEESASTAYETGYFIAPSLNQSEMVLVNTHSSREILSLISDSSNETILRELKQLLVKMGTVSPKSSRLTHHVCFEFGQAGFHPKVIALINKQLNALLYWITSKSVRDNVFYDEDLFALNHRLEGFHHELKDIESFIRGQLEEERAVQQES